MGICGSVVYTTKQLLTYQMFVHSNPHDTAKVRGANL
jgi:hypothetical protein